MNENRNSLTENYNNMSKTKECKSLRNFELLNKFLGKDNRKLIAKLNIIDPGNISIINSVSLFNSIFSECYGEMYHNFVLVRKFIYTNKEFLNCYLNSLLKLVHTPNILWSSIFKFPSR